MAFFGYFSGLCFSMLCAYSSLLYRNKSYFLTQVSNLYSQFSFFENISSLGK